MGDHESRQSGDEMRDKIIDAAASLLDEKGVRELTVSAIMKRAGLSRTAFYRRFDEISGVVAALLELLETELFSQAGDWFDDVDSVGRRDVVWENALRDGRAIKARITLFRAIIEATAIDESLRTTWRTVITQQWIDATAAAIRRDQAAGAVRSGLDPDAAALALTVMSEQLALEVLGYRDGQPEEYASILAPIWEAVLFGVDDL